MSDSSKTPQNSNHLHLEVPTPAWFAADPSVVRAKILFWFIFLVKVAMLLVGVIVEAATLVTLFDPACKRNNTCNDVLLV